MCVCVGALYPDNTTAELKADDAVPPGLSHTYTWIVQSESAPAEGDAPCLSWAYHSHVDAPKDIASGLIGPLLTCRKGHTHTHTHTHTVIHVAVLTISEQRAVYVR